MGLDFRLLLSYYKMTIYTTNVRSSYLEGLAFHIKPKTHEYLFLGKSYDGFAHKKTCK